MKATLTAPEAAEYLNFKNVRQFRTAIDRKEVPPATFRGREHRWSRFILDKVLAGDWSPPQNVHSHEDRLRQELLERIDAS